MTEVQISQTIYTEVKKSLQQKYLQTFGENACADEVVSLSRTQFLATYANNILFWQDNLPDISAYATQNPPDDAILARHALCENAIHLLYAHARKKNVASEVEDHLRVCRKTRGDSTEAGPRDETPASPARGSVLPVVSAPRQPAF